MKRSTFNFPTSTFPRFFIRSLCLLSFSQFSLALPHYINEFHYDNTGADKFEYVEVAGVAGTDLSGWHLDFYNGTNGKIYASWALSGLIDNESSGFGALSFSASKGLQNGPNDGIALVNDMGALIQFISYEGSLVGSEGAALGVTSQDIGLAEGGSVPVGHSLQLTGVGQDSEDFIWTSTQSSFGELNLAQIYQQTPKSNNLQTVSEPNSLGLVSLSLLGLMSCRRLAFRQ